MAVDSARRSPHRVCVSRLRRRTNKSTSSDERGHSTKAVGLLTTRHVRRSTLPSLRTRIRTAFPVRVSRIHRARDCSPPMDSCSTKKDRSSHHDSQSGSQADSMPTRWSMKRYARMLLKHARQYAFAPMAPESLVSRVRWVVFMLTCLAQFVYLPLVPIYFSCDDSTVITINAVFECIFLSEMLFSFNSSYFDSKMAKLVTSRREIAVRYLRG